MSDAFRHLCYVAVCALLRASSPQAPRISITHLSMQTLSQKKNVHFVHKKRLPTVAEKHVGFMSYNRRASVIGNFVQHGLFI